MPFIEECRGITGRRNFVNDDWREFLPGQCPLARMILPYLVPLHRQLVSSGRVFLTTSTRLVEIEDYDDYMSVHAVLAVLIASSVNTNDDRWLEDSALIATLKGFESGKVTPYRHDEDHGWRKHCLMARIDLGVVGDMWSANTSTFRTRFFCSVGAPAEGNVSRVGDTVDRCGVQSLKDIFYVVTGARTPRDTCVVHPWERSSAVDLIPTGREEVLTWDHECPTVDSAECWVGMCDHLMGVIPLIGRIRRPNGRDGTMVDES